MNDREDHVREKAINLLSIYRSSVNTMLKKDAFYEFINLIAKETKHFPPEILEEIICDQDGSLDKEVFLEFAIKNPNCPTDARIKGMIKHGDISVENPEHDIIEHDDVELQKDDSLEKFRKLLNKEDGEDKDRIL